MFLEELQFPLEPVVSRLDVVDETIVFVVFLWLFVGF